MKKLIVCICRSTLYYCNFTRGTPNSLISNSFPQRHSIMVSIFEFSRIFIPSLNERIDSRENWTPAQNGRLDWVGGGD